MESGATPMSSLSIFCFCLLLLIVARAANNFRRLSIPGPFLASISDLWRFYHQNRGHGLRTRLLDLHLQHGPVVRYGVRSVSISSPDAISRIYGSRAGFVTADSYKVLVGISNGKEVPSLVSTADESKHRALRRSIAGAFTPNGVLSLEPCMHQTMREFRDILGQNKEAINLPMWMLLFSMDSAARQAFSENRGYLAAGEDVDGSIQLIRNRFNHWGRWSSLPGVENIIYRNAVSIKRKQTPSSMAAAAIAKLSSRISRIGTEKAPTDLLQSFVSASEAHPDLLDKTGIVGLLMSTISGAGDTTATTLTAIIYFLLTHPSDLHDLVSELKNNDVQPLPSYHETSKLPFLNAVIRESMRCFSTATWPIERLVPKGGITVAGYDIPEGVSVGVLPAALHLDKDVYGPDADIFRPARWLEASEERLRAMESSHMGFSKGRRVCLGQSIAVMQIKKVIPMLVLHFDIQLADPHAKLDADFSPAVACLKPLMVHLSPIAGEN